MVPRELCNVPPLSNLKILNFYRNLSTCHKIIKRNTAPQLTPKMTIMPETRTIILDALHNAQIKK